MPPLHRLPLGRSADYSPSSFPREPIAYGFDNVFCFRCVISGLFTFTFSALTCQLHADFSAVAHDRGLLSSSRTAWFDACLCRPTPRGLPSSPSVAPKNRSFSPSFTSHIGCPISRSLTTSCVCLELRLLPSTGVTRLQRYYEPLRHPRAPGPSLAGVRLLTAERALAFPVLRALSLCTCCRQYPGTAAGILFAQSPNRISLPR